MAKFHISNNGNRVYHAKGDAVKVSYNQGTEGRTRNVGTGWMVPKKK